MLPAVLSDPHDLPGTLALWIAHAGQILAMGCAGCAGRGWVSNKLINLWKYSAPVFE